MNPLTNLDFIEQMRAVVMSGGGFVPFIGSGCSAPSGIIMGEQFNVYLRHVVMKCLNVHKEFRPWCLHTSGWPAPPTTQNKTDNKVIWDQWNLWNAGGGADYKKYPDLHRQAFKALSDWRDTLRFLSRLSVTDSGEVKAGPVRAEGFIDDFNTHITREARPNLIHLMLCHLASVARIRVLLNHQLRQLDRSRFC